MYHSIRRYSYPGAPALRGIGQTLLVKVQNPCVIEETLDPRTFQFDADIVPPARFDLARHPTPNPRLIVLDPAARIAPTAEIQKVEVVVRHMEHDEKALAPADLARLQPH